MIVWLVRRKSPAAWKFEARRSRQSGTAAEQAIPRIVLDGHKIGMKTTLGWLSVMALSCLLALRAAGQAIPEPSLTLYGAITNRTSLGDLRLSCGTLTWRFIPTNGGAPVLLTAQLTNINDQFSYRLRIPCESPIGSFMVSSNMLSLRTPPLTYDRSQVTVDSVAATLSPPALGAFTLSRSERGRIARVDLVVSLPCCDSDGNGLCDDWEMRNFGHLGVLPNADTDHDGMTNLQEMMAGTDPNDPTSSFAFIDVRAASGGVEIRWSSIAGHAYTLQRSRDLLTGFVDLRTGIAATAPINSYLDTHAPAASQSFYRLRLEP